MTEKLKVGAIGTAWAAQSPLPAMSTHPEVELVAICSARMQRAKEAADKFGASQAFDDYQKMIDQAGIDAVYVGGPVGLHAEMTVAAARAGKHVLCEKPIATNVREGREMLDFCEKAGVAHLIAFTMRNYPAQRHIKRLVDGGAIGKVRHISANLWFAIPPQAPRVYGWLQDASRGGGMLNAMGSHTIDLVRYWFGDFARVSGETRIWRKELPDADGKPQKVTADDSFVLQASLKNGAAVSIHMSSEIAGGGGARVELYGDEGTIRLEGMDELFVGKAGAQSLDKVEVTEPKFAAGARKCEVPRFGEYVSRLAQWARSGSAQKPSLEDGLRCQEVIDGLRRSEKEGRVVTL